MVMMSMFKFPVCDSLGKDGGRAAGGHNSLLSSPDTPLDNLALELPPNRAWK